MVNISHSKIVVYQHQIIYEFDPVREQSIYYLLIDYKLNAKT